MDTPAIEFNRFMIVGNDLRIGSNVLLNFDETTFTEGVTIDTVIFDAASKPQEGSEIASKFLDSDRFSPAVPIFVYEATLDIPDGVDSFEVTVQDMSGNPVTMVMTLD